MISWIQKNIGDGKIAVVVSTMIVIGVAIATAMFSNVFKKTMNTQNTEGGSIYEDMMVMDVKYGTWKTQGGKDMGFIKEVGDDIWTTKSEHDTMTEKSMRYFGGFNTTDLHVRRASNVEEYVSMYKNAWRNETLGEKQKRWIEERVEEAQKYIKGTVLEHIPWRISVVDNYIEGGFPHTLENVIVLPIGLITNISDRRSQEIVVKILIHELCHVFQRRYPQLVEKLYIQWGYQKVSGEDSAKNLLNMVRDVRSNPDVFDVYTKNGKGITVCLYKEGANDMLSCDKVYIKSNGDVGGQVILNGVHNGEHPNEIMAEMVPALLMKGDNEDIMDNKKMMTHLKAFLYSQ